MISSKSNKQDGFITPQIEAIINRQMLHGKTSLIFSTYFLINLLLVLTYPTLRYFTSAGTRSLKVSDKFGFTYQNSIIYTVLALAAIAYIRSTSNLQFFIDFLTVGKIGVVCLLFFAKFTYCLYYIGFCLLSWLVVPYPRLQSANKFIRVQSVQEFDRLIKEPVKVEKGAEFKFRHLQYRDKMMCFVEFYADWVLPSIFAKQIWYAYSNKYTTNQLKFLSVNVSKLPELAERYQINTSGFSKQIPTIIVIENGEEDIRFPPIGKNNKVSKVAKYDYKILLRFFDLESRYLETRK